ncbi:MAG: AAA family ATPase [Bacillota bacterium]
MSDRGTKIALCGGARSGKDTVAEYLVLNHNFTRFAFGDAIRGLCWSYFPERMGGGKDRPLLQGVGQDLRKYDPDIWIKRTFTEIEDVRVKSRYLRGFGYNGLNVVISDLRQPNEYAALREQGYVIVRVDASPEDRIRRAEASGDIFRPEDMQHDTERHYASFIVDYEVCNDGSLEQLYEQTERVYAAITGGAAHGFR